MSYNAKNEKQTILADLEKNDNGDIIRVAKVENGENTSFDIRNMYKTESGEPGYTKKGVRLSYDMTLDVIFSILSQLPADEYNEFIDRINSANNS